MAKYDPLAYVNVKSPKALAGYKPIKNNVAPYVPGVYQSQYADQIAASRDNLTNWKYNPLEDASYQALAKIYGARGNVAAKNTLADAAALNGGYQTSYAVSAAQQARNQYNQELAALIPDLEDKAYNRTMAQYNLYKEADDTDYGRFRDTEGDRQWKYTQDYQNWRDRESDNQWLYNTMYNNYRDQMADYQWGLDYNQGVYGLKKAASSGGGGGGRGRSGGGGGGGYGGYASDPNLTELYNNAKDTSVVTKQIKKAATDIASSGNTTIASPSYRNLPRKMTK